LHPDVIEEIHEAIAELNHIQRVNKKTSPMKATRGDELDTVRQMIASSKFT